MFKEWFSKDKKEEGRGMNMEEYLNAHKGELEIFRSLTDSWKKKVWNMLGHERKKFIRLGAHILRNILRCLNIQRELPAGIRTLRSELYIQLVMP